MLAEMAESMDCLQEVKGVRMISLSKMAEGLSAFGYQEYELPKPKKFFDFKTLDGKAMRIMNRLAAAMLVQLEAPLKNLKTQLIG